jgi:hypothetical protein
MGRRLAERTDHHFLGSTLYFRPLISSFLSDAPVDLLVP